MVPHIDKCGANIQPLLRTAAMTGEVLEAKEMFGKFTFDSIATSGFGIESNSFEDPDNIFRINALKLIRWDISKKKNKKKHSNFVLQRSKIRSEDGPFQVHADGCVT